MYFISSEQAADLKLEGLDFQIGPDNGILVEDGPYEARRKEMGFKDTLEATELEGIIQVTSMKFPKTEKPAIQAPMASSMSAEIVAQANQVMKEQIKLLQLINKLNRKA